MRPARSETPVAAHPSVLRAITVFEPSWSRRRTYLLEGTVIKTSPRALKASPQIQGALLELAYSASVNLGDGTTPLFSLGFSIGYIPQV